MRKISACIITLNEERCIEACVRSLSMCDEVLVIDAHSTDRTREIAERCGARVIERDWPGYRSQKQFAVDSAQHDWILSIDADERLSEPLAAEISALKKFTRDDHAAYDIPFLASYFGHPIKHGDWYPESHVRLFDRRRGGFGGAEIHEKVIVTGAVGRLEGHICHDSYQDLDHQLGKLGRYASLVAGAMAARGKRAGGFHMIFNPLWRFFRAYILRRGFLDGWRGLAVAHIEANYVWEKYLRLYVDYHSRRDASRNSQRSH